MENLVFCITAAGVCCEKDGHHGKQAYIIDVEGAVSLWVCIFQTDGLV